MQALRSFAPLFTLVLVLWFPGPATYAAERPEKGSLAGLESLVKSGKFEEAYQLIALKPERTAADYYNAGTLAYQAGHIGPALADLEKANALHRHDPDIRHNLEIARETLGRTLGSEDRLDPASTWSEKLADHISIEELRGVLGLVALAVFMFWTRSYLRQRSVRACFSSIGSLLGAATLILVAALYFADRAAEAQPPAIVLARTSVRSGPGKSFAEVAQLDGGIKLRVLGSESANAQIPGMAPLLSTAAAATEAPKEASPESDAAWFQVRYSAEEIGWVPASAVLLID